MLKYKGYYGKVQYDDEAGILHGEVLGINDIITFQADSAKEIEKEFKASVKDYLEFCKKEDRSPEKSLSGETRLRMGEERHKKVSLAVNCSNEPSMNDWLLEAIDEKLKKKTG